MSLADDLTELRKQSAALARERAKHRGEVPIVRPVPVLTPNLVPPTRWQRLVAVLRKPIKAK